jgi:hypothetical protein
LTTLLPSNSLCGILFCLSLNFDYFATSKLSIWTTVLSFAIFWLLYYHWTLYLDEGSVFRYLLTILLPWSSVWITVLCVCYLFDCFAIIELSIWIMISNFYCYLLSTMLSPNSLLLDHDFSLLLYIATIRLSLFGSYSFDIL